ncbi:MAG: hypothetical protein M0R28_24770 [Pigmentiphaga sp.]|nr:hypothetical protein [Pigmentiphaga sp.]
MRHHRLTVRSIAQVVGDYYGIGWNDLSSVRRTASIVRARQVVMFLCREHTTLSLPQIGRRLGGRDHTTVLHACRKIESLRAIDPEFRREYRDVESLVLEREAALARDLIVPEPDIDPFEIASRIVAAPTSDWSVTIPELRALAHAVILRRPAPDEVAPVRAAPVPAETPKERPTPPAAPAGAVSAVPMPVQRVLKTYRAFENARFSPRERGEREAFERALNALSNHLNTESNHVRH